MQPPPSYKELESEILLLEKKLSARKNIEKIIRDSEIRFRQLYENAPLACLSLDEQGNFLEVNETWLCMSGYEKDEIIGKNFGDFLAPEQRVCFTENFLRFRAAGEISGPEFTMRTKNGESIPLVFKGKIGKDEKGNFCRAHCILYTDSPQKQTEKENRRQSGGPGRNPELCEQLKELKCLFSISRLIDRPEAAPENVFPKITEIIRSGWQYPHDTCVRILFDQSEFRSVNYRKTPWRQTGDIIVYDRKTGMVEVSYLKEYPKKAEGPFLQEERILIDTIANRLGIHIQRKKAEKDLKESRERLSLALEAADDGIWDWNLLTDEVYFSPRCFTMLGYETDEAGAGFQTWEKLLHPEDRDIFLKRMKKHISGREQKWESEFRLRNKKGKWQWIMSRGRVMERDEAGLPLRMLGTHRDISLRKEQEEMQQIAHYELEDRIARRTIDLVKVNRSLLSEIRVRRQAEKRLAESEHYLNNVLDTMQAGVLIIDEESHIICDVNRYASRMIGLKKEEIIGRVCFRFLCSSKECECPVRDTDTVVENAERILLTAGGRHIPVLKSVSRIQREHQHFLVESFIDIRELKALLKEQEMDIHTARNILHLNNGDIPPLRHISDSYRLLCRVIALPCHKEGGDHFFLYTRQTECGPDKSVFSLKDQSGHNVGCLLRSILTDMLHLEILKKNPDASVPETLSMLNDRIVRDAFFGRSDFVTAIIGEIRHENLMMEYMLCGHSHFLLVREGNIFEIPEKNSEKAKNMPVGALDGIVFASDHLQLCCGDILLLYTDGLSEDLLRLKNLETADIVRQILTDEPEIPLGEMLPKILREVSAQIGKKIDPSGINLTGDDITLFGLEIENCSDYAQEIWQPEDLSGLQVCIDRFYQKQEKEWERRGFENPCRLRLVLAESAVNAWKHGNGSDPRRKITVRCRYKDNFLLEIEDEGQGFDPEKIPNPAYGACILKTHGRGLMMIRCYADCISFNSKGNCITAVFDKKGKINTSGDAYKAE